jgi:F1F0 ATPase subunit 2
MNQLPSMILSLLAGVLLGIIFFGGLWWTVQRGVRSTHTAILFAGSLMLRTATALAGFYFVSHGNWQRLLACLFGFFVARVSVTQLTRVAVEKPAPIVHTGGR